MRKRSLLMIGASLLIAALALGAIACGDDEDDGDGAAPTATEAVGEEPTATTAADGEPTEGEPSAFATIIVTENADLGPILTTTDGYTVYQFDNDEPGVSNCGEGCVDLWLPLPVAGTPTGGEGVTGELGTITRDDGSIQVTYDGLPLYYYANDPSPGDTNGDGIGGVWHVVSVGG